MKRVLLVGAAAFSMVASAQVTCTQVGAYTSCSDGTTAQRIGNTTYITPPPGNPVDPRLRGGISAADDDQPRMRRADPASAWTPPPTLPMIQMDSTPPSLLNSIANPQRR